MFRELGQPYGISQALNYLGDIARLQGDYTAAATWYAESLALLRRSTIKGGIPSVLHNMGYVLLAQDQIQRAAAFFAEGLTLQQENGDQQGIAECLAGLAAVAANRQQSERAARLFGAAEALRAVTDGPARIFIGYPDVAYELSGADGMTLNNDTGIGRSPGFHLRSCRPAGAPDRSGATTSRKNSPAAVPVFPARQTAILCSP